MIRDKKFLKNSLFVTLVFVIGLMSCEKKDAINSSPDVKLGFSMDTVMFDTVFSTVGSTTKDFRIYNNSSSAIEISSITLARGNKSQFRINVDGVSGTDFSDIKIYPNDSLYVFVRVTIDPTEENLPFV
ncbi:MAG: hypothetical protein U9R32_09440, partial [Bacteroidota bacterium]|nr:hypothetical protein [Bacteroidota bacterium]